MKEEKLKEKERKNESLIDEKIDWDELINFFDNDVSAHMEKTGNIVEEEHLSDEQKIKREKNKLTARKTRQRKKLLKMSLISQIQDLSKENKVLSDLIERQNNSIKPSPDNLIFASVLDRFPTGSSFIITDPCLPDNPIVFASQTFLDLCQYQLEEVLGRNCRFLQGEDTDKKQIEMLRDGIRERKDLSLCILNYRKDGSRFYNQLHISPLFNTEGGLIYFVGIQNEIISK